MLIAIYVTAIIMILVAGLIFISAKLTEDFNKAVRDHDLKQDKKWAELKQELNELNNKKELDKFKKKMGNKHTTKPRC